MDSNRSIRHEKINTYRRKIKTLPKKGCQNKNDLILFNHKKQKKAGKKWLEPLVHYIWTNLINRLTAWVALLATKNKHTTYLSSTGLFAEEKYTSQITEYATGRFLSMQKIF